jgi:hypothetical protein
MKWMWFNFAALIVGLSLILHGAPALPVLVGVAGAGLVKRLAR